MRTTLWQDRQRDLLATCAASILGTTRGISVERLVPPNSSAPSDVNNLRMDVVIDMSDMRRNHYGGSAVQPSGITHTFADIRTVCVASVVDREPALHAGQPGQPGVASARAEGEKNDKYEARVQNDTTAAFLPIVFEDGGRWSETADAFLRALTALGGAPRTKQAAQCKFWRTAFAVCNARGVANLICIGLKQRPRTNPTCPTRHAHINATRSHAPLVPSLHVSPAATRSQLPVSPAATRIHAPLVRSIPVSPAATCSHAPLVRSLPVSPAPTSNPSSLSTAHTVATPHTGPNPTTGCSSSTQSEVETLPMLAASFPLVDAHLINTAQAASQLTSSEFPLLVRSGPSSGAARQDTMLTSELPDGSYLSPLSARSAQAHDPNGQASLATRWESDSLNLGGHNQL